MTEAWCYPRWLIAAICVGLGALIATGCGSTDGSATLVRRRTGSAPLPSAADVGEVAELLTARGVRCEVGDQRASTGSCSNDQGAFVIAVYPDESAIPEAQGPVCSAHAGPEAVEGMKVVFEARGENFVVSGSPPGAKDIQSTRRLWSEQTEITGRAASAAGLDVLEFTVHCT